MNWNRVFSFALTIAVCLLFRSHVMLDPQKYWRQADRSSQESVVPSPGNVCIQTDSSLAQAHLPAILLVMTATNMVNYSVF